MINICSHPRLCDTSTHRAAANWLLSYEISGKISNIRIVTQCIKEHITWQSDVVPVATPQSVWPRAEACNSGMIWSRTRGMWTRRCIVGFHISRECLLRFEVLTAVNMKITVFWDVIPCRLVNIYKYFGGTCCLHLQERRIRRADEQGQ
jgi:hypothetical protein